MGLDGVHVAGDKKDRTEGKIMDRKGKVHPRPNQKVRTVQALVEENQRPDHCKRTLERAMGERAEACWKCHSPTE